MGHWARLYDDTGRGVHAARLGQALRSFDNKVRNKRGSVQLFACRCHGNSTEPGILDQLEHGPGALHLV